VIFRQDREVRPFGCGLPDEGFGSPEVVLDGDILACVSERL
jgi:hypothetical protein